MKIYFYKVTSWKRLFTVWQVQLARERHRGYSYTSPEITSTIMYIGLYISFTFFVNCSQGIIRIMKNTVIYIIHYYLGVAQIE